MATVCSFAPVARGDARLLILGSMPGRMSLERQQYYAHPQNLFWRIMGELFGATPDLPYPVRLECLRTNQVALWDVMQQCERENSLDADIVEASILTNDFASFFAEHAGITRLFFNGSKAEQTFRKYVLPTLDGNKLGEYQLTLHRLPSTSPANASMALADKVRAWHALKAEFTA